MSGRLASRRARGSENAGAVGSCFDLGLDAVCRCRCALLQMLLECCAVLLDAECVLLCCCTASNCDLEREWQQVLLTVLIASNLAVLYCCIASS